MALTKFNRRTVREDSGAIISGATITFYDQDSGDPVAVYEDVNGSSSLGSSVMSEDDGSVPVFMSPGVYRITVESGGDLIAEYTYEAVFNTAFAEDDNSVRTHIFSQKEVPTYAAALNLDPNDYLPGETIYIYGDGIAGNFVVTSGAIPDSSTGVLLSNATWNAAGKHLKIIEPRANLTPTRPLVNRLRGSCSLISHRGREWGPENTVTGMMELPVGVDGVEFDVRLTSDGEIVCMHDTTVDRTTDGTGAVAELTYDYIRGLDAGSFVGGMYTGARVPNLREYITAARAKGIKFLLMQTYAMSSTSDAQKYLDVIEDMNAKDYVIAMCNDVDQLEIWRQVDPDGLCGIFGTTLLNGRLEAAISAGACLVLTPPGDGNISANAGVYSAAIESGVLAGASTTNNPDEFRDGMINKGCNVILTDYTSTFLPYMEAL